MPLAWAGRDLICSAATGSGKTAAYLIPTVQELLDEADADEPESPRDEEEEEEDSSASALEPLWDVPKSSAASSTRGGYGRRRAGTVVSVDAALDADLDYLFSEDADEDVASASASDPRADLTTPASPRVLVLVPTRELAAQCPRRVVWSSPRVFASRCFTAASR